MTQRQKRRETERVREVEGCVVSLSLKRQTRAENGQILFSSFPSKRWMDEFNNDVASHVRGLTKKMRWWNHGQLEDPWREPTSQNFTPRGPSGNA